ncbi:Chitinase [Bertholletia excelsa]
MAKASNKFLNMVLIISLLIVSVVVAFKATNPSCDAVVRVEEGDTCFAIAQEFNLTTDFFDSINPNIDCRALFVGQWVCVDGSTS